MSKQNLNKLIELLKKLSNAFGPPGYEEDLHQIIKSELSNCCSFTYDNLGSIICSHKNNNKKNVLKVGIFTHIDEVGFMIRGITSNGYLKFITLGSLLPHTLPSQKVLIKNSEGKLITGIIGMKPPHLMTDDEKAKVSKIENLYIDIGAKSFDEVVNDYKIDIGTYAVPYTLFDNFNKPNLFYGKAFDNRSGVCSMIEILKQTFNLKENIEVIGVGTVQEESGLRGAKTSTLKVMPDFAIVIDTPPADDTPNNETGFAPQGVLGMGPQVRLYDPTIIVSHKLISYVKNIVKKYKLKAQFAVRTSGGTDAGAIHLSNIGIPTLILGIPARYIHSHTSVIDINDITATVELSLKVIENLPKFKLSF